MPRLNLILQFWNVLSICRKNFSSIFFRIQDLPHRRTGLMNYLLCALSHLSHGDQWQRKQQQIFASTGWRRGRWNHRPSVRDWGKGICWNRKIPGCFCPFPTMNSTCPTPELVFSFFFFLITVLSPSANFFLFLPSSFKYFGIILYLCQSAQRYQQKIKPCCAGLFSNV